jgi:hypothetical protein
MDPPLFTKTLPPEWLVAGLRVSRVMFPMMPTVEFPVDRVSEPEDAEELLPVETETFPLTSL